MGYMTKRQRVVVEDIEKKLGIEYEGNNSPTHADRFIKKYIGMLRDYNKKAGIPPHPTQDQARLIRAIEKDGRVKFTGKTFKDAIEFIDEYIHYAEFKSPKRVYW